MKKLQKISILILVSFFIFSCKSDDDNNSNPNDSNPNDSIIGVWKPLREIDECPNGETDTFEYNECEQSGRLTFNSNGSYAEFGMNGNINDCQIDYEDTGSWSIDNENLTITLSGESFPVTFFEINNNTLKLGQYDDDECAGGWYYLELVRVN